MEKCAAYPLPYGRCSVCNKSLLKIKGVHEELVGGVRLAAPLRAEPEQNHAAPAVGNLEGGGFTLNALRVEQVAAGQGRPIARISRQDDAFEFGLGIEGRAALKHDHRLRKQARSQRMLRVLD